MGSIDEKIGLLNAHYDTILSDIKCLQSFKQKCIENTQTVKSLQKTQEEYWKLHDEYILSKKQIRINKSEIKSLRAKLKNYRQIEKLYKEYDDLKFTLIKHAVLIIILGLISGLLGAKAYSYLP